MDLYPGAKVFIRNNEYEILKINWTYGTVTCIGPDGKIKDFKLDELEDK